MFLWYLTTCIKIKKHDFYAGPIDFGISIYSSLDFIIFILSEIKFLTSNVTYPDQNPS